jgi:TatD DNase family protein
VANGSSSHSVYFDALFRDSKNRVVAPPVLPAAARLADTHAHLDMLRHPHLALARAAAHGLRLVVTVVDPNENPAYTLSNIDDWLAKAQILLDRWTQQGLLAQWTAEGLLATTTHDLNGLTPPQVRVIIGCHPHNASRYDASAEAELISALPNSQVVGIGEIGLDYHYDNSPRDVQQQVFRRQLELAHTQHLSVALHLREAHADGLRILQEVGLPPAGALLHCFTSDFATLEPFLAMGCLVAFGGALTFRKAEQVRDAACHTPIDRLVVETDSPFMAPHPLRGTVCGPENIVFTAALLADLHNSDSSRVEPASGPHAAAPSLAALTVAPSVCLPPSATASQPPVVSLPAPILATLYDTADHFFQR